jgi:hypothetical protein
VQPSTRHSLRPSLFGALIDAQLGQIMSREREVVTAMFRGPSFETPLRGSSG